jgi:hypothetical protein
MEFPKVVEFSPHLGQPQCDVVSAGQGNTPRLCQGNRFSDALEQSDLESAFQGADLGTDGGLGQVQLVRGTREAVVSRNGLKSSQLGQRCHTLWVRFKRATAAVDINESL